MLTKLSKETPGLHRKPEPSSQPEDLTNTFAQTEPREMPVPITGLHDRGRIAIFVDGSNLFYAAMQMGIEIDYTKLLCYLTQGSQLLRAFFYTGTDRVNDKQQGFLLWMRRNGYRVVTKDLVQLPDGSKKANLDVEIAVDMMTLADHYDTAVLVSGDGDLAYAVDAVSYRGARIEVVSLRSMTSDSLINVADQYTDMGDLKPYIQKLPRSTYTYQPLSP
jgi:uncharacterized LabA/DUF88 family protein